MNVVALKRAVRERDGFRCVECGMTNEEHLAKSGTSLQVHRLVPRSRYTLEGCVTLCHKCHGPKPRTPRSTPFAIDQQRNGCPVLFFMKPEHAEALDAYLASQRPRLSRPAVIRHAIELFLESQGMWPPPKDQEKP